MGKVIVALMGAMVGFGVGLGGYLALERIMPHHLETRTLETPIDLSIGPVAAGVLTAVGGCVLSVVLWNECRK